MPRSSSVLDAWMLNLPKHRLGRFFVMTCSRHLKTILSPLKPIRLLTCTLGLLIFFIDILHSPIESHSLGARHVASLPLNGNFRTDLNASLFPVSRISFRHGTRFVTFRKLLVLMPKHVMQPEPQESTRSRSRHELQLTHTTVLKSINSSSVSHLKPNEGLSSYDPNRDIFLHHMRSLLRCVTMSLARGREIFIRSFILVPQEFPSVVSS